MCRLIQQPRRDSRQVAYGIQRKRGDRFNAHPTVLLAWHDGLLVQLTASTLHLAFQPFPNISAFLIIRHSDWWFVIDKPIPLSHKYISEAPQCLFATKRTG